MAIVLPLDRVVPPVRPVQYLGSKSRVVAAITDALPAARPGSRALDLFSGSSVVAQVLAHSGYAVTAVDALGFAATLARATLGIAASDRDDPELLARTIVASAPPVPDLEAAFAVERERERAALRRGDADTLLDQVVEAPEAWPSPGAESNDVLARLPANGYQYGLATVCYAGTYIGFEQALETDRVLASIAQAGTAGWSRDVLVAACLSAVSACAFTAGKHFAQYHRVDVGKRTEFHRRRILQDRRLQVTTLFLRAVRCIASAGRKNAGAHSAVARPVDEFFRDVLEPQQLIYADPPYTAQQYSRFYHVLEVLDAGNIPSLQQRSDGTATRGLYPSGRYLSPFCSRRDAPGAFQRLLKFAARHTETFALSYSASRGASTGNSRTVDYEALVQLCRSSFRRVRHIDLNHRYRRFNPVQMDSDDRELLLICSQ
ncbi:MAG TPA: DNA adenine methylase [Candidatus Cybelea sp.]|nr:DNA adenine methylase [Candidatus Cybelea sp.]